MRGQAMSDTPVCACCKYAANTLHAHETEKESRFEGETVEYCTICYETYFAVMDQYPKHRDHDVIALMRGIAYLGNMILERIERRARMTVRNNDGLPFSKWAPADKFAFAFENQYSDLFAHCETEFELDDNRKWRFDFAWEQIQLAVEIDGFGFGHQAQQRIAQNNEKRNAAVACGWRVLVYDSRLLGSREAVEDAVHQVAECIINWD